MSKRERLEAAIAGERADRVPVAFWRHFPVDDQTPAALAESVVAFQQTYDFDFVKVTPASSFCLKDWGVQDRWQGALEGTRTYTKRVISETGDWADLATLAGDQGHLADQLDCLSEIRERLGPEVPVIQTIFSPLSQAKNLAGPERLIQHLHQDWQAVRRGLETIARSTVSFVECARERGIDGIFYAVQHASFRYFDRDAYHRFGEPGDHQILEAADGLWLNVLHLHGEALMFDLAEEYSAQVVNWHDQLAGPSLAEAIGRVNGAVCGGLERHDTMLLSDPATVRSRAESSIRSVEGRGLILGAGCVVPTITPRSNLLAARQAAWQFA